MELKIGDVVCLKSDPNVYIRMTINGYSHDGNDYWTCAWFDKYELRQASFHKDALRKLE
ncbi:MAG: YodC family protein [Chryseobacterium jejuense]|uniref:YodC family protein n=1 Tax=Chryseobacterium jejuense TaxID=445960 RepID=UPI003D11D516